jgi:16S rRNA (adenine1518-N6/adenine1519-N6)-dimethyltransferase
MSAIDDLPPLRDVIREHSLSARKSLGQNFLLDLNLTGRIARAAGPLEGATVIEIGPGPGGLTRALLALGAGASSRSSATSARWRRSRRSQSAIPAGSRSCTPTRSTSIRGRCWRRAAKIVANLPYNIATALLVDWLSIEPWPPWYDMMVLMFQREVAERIVAQEDDEAYGRLAVLAAHRGQSGKASAEETAP